MLAGALSLAVLAVAGAALTQPTPPYEPPLDDGERIVDAHAARLANASGFTYESRTRLTVNGSVRTNRTETALFDQVSGASLVDHRSPRFGRTRIYDDGAGSSVQRLDAPDGGVRYGRPLDLSSMQRFRRAGLAPLLTDVDYDYVGPTRLDGVRVHEYAATELDQASDFFDGVRENSSAIRSVDLRVYVSNERVIRRLEISLVRRGDDGSRTLDSAIAYRDVGETTVTAPDWVDEARNRTAPAR